MNSSPTLDIPYLVSSLRPINTFSPFLDKLMWTCDPEPISVSEYLEGEEYAAHQRLTSLMMLEVSMFALKQR